MDSVTLVTSNGDSIDVCKLKFLEFLKYLSNSVLVYEVASCSTLLKDLFQDFHGVDNSATSIPVPVS
jgi:hypothetical protein